MRKITILEVWDPCINEYIQLKQAINQGLFNTQTFLFFNPIEQEYYSITEAAKRGLFKSAIDLRPESLIVERVKIVQRVLLKSARNPLDFDALLTINEAISKGVVDTNLRVYRTKDEIISLNEAIERDLLQVEVANEITEKITETLTEKKSADNLGLVKKVETSSTSNIDQVSIGSSASSFDSTATPTDSLQQINGTYMMDLPKSTNTSKRIRKKSEEFAAGFITDYNSQKILEQSNAKVRSILKSGSKSLNPVIDLNEAIKEDMVILHDSPNLMQNVKYVIDLKTGKRLDFDTACKRGIIDVFNRLYVDTRTNKKINLFEALGKFYIIMNEEVSSDDERPKLKAKKSSLAKKKLTESDIVTFFNPRTGDQISINEAKQIGLFDQRTNYYVDAHKNRLMTLEEAVEKGMAVLKQDNLTHEVNEGYQFLYINGVINPSTRTEMPLNEAIDQGILDYVECELHDAESGQTLTLLEAYEKGLLITSAKNYNPTPASETASNPNKSCLVETNRLGDFKIKKNSSQSNSKLPLKVDNPLLVNKSQSVEMAKKQNPPVCTNQNTLTNQLLKSQSQSPLRNSKRETTSDHSSSRGKSIDRFSITSRASILSRFKDKLFGKNTKKKQFRCEETLILESLRILDTQTNEKHGLRDAIALNIAIPDDRIRDTANQVELTIREALELSIIRFCFADEKNFEYVQRENCFVCDNALYLVSYVLDPRDQKKLNLADAVARQIVDLENMFYFGRKGAYTLDLAIQKGYIASRQIDLNLLNAVVVSNVLKYSKYTPPPPQVDTEAIETIDEYFSKVDNMQDLVRLDLN